NKYSVDGYEILNDDVEWREDTIPRIQITLTANDDYYFQSLPKDKVTIKGGAEFKNSKREDSSTTLLMEVELQALNTSLHALNNVVLTEDGIAAWDAIPAAGSYEVRVYRDDKAVGAVMTVGTNTCNCRERLQKGDTAYTVRVRPVSKFDAKEKGDWAESPSTYIPEEKAARFRENPTGGNGEWAQTPENGRWWYRNADGSYPANSWQQIGGKWYFFDAQGYMVTGWVQWDGKEYYCSDNGEMLTNCLTPDSFWVGEDGAKINQ
ncbi:hypothetical protein, partial [Enterocloster clostridioformis]